MEKCISLNETIIILEDDIDIADNFCTIVNQLQQKNLYSYGYIRLDHSYKPSGTWAIKDNLVK